MFSRRTASRYESFWLHAGKENGALRKKKNEKENTQHTHQVKRSIATAGIRSKQNANSSVTPVSGRNEMPRDYYAASRTSDKNEVRRASRFLEKLQLFQPRHSSA